LFPYVSSIALNTIVAPPLVNQSATPSEAAPTISPNQGTPSPATSSSNRALPTSLVVTAGNVLAAAVLLLSIFGAVCLIRDKKRQ
ncbi:MAG: hypothetical protein AAB701_01620, partial [Patescibacteria group bacterium]